MSRVFILSPANCNGLRARWVLKKRSRSELAMRLRSAGVSLGEVFTYLSALYFRGKLAYARRFAQPPDPTDSVTAGGVLVITPNAGLRSADTPITIASLQAFASVSIDLANPAYRRPLEQGALALREAIGPDCEVVLLGSIATGKYLDILNQALGDQLRVPAEFVGLGDMSRGALLLRCVKEQRELNYISVAVASERVGRRALAPEAVQPSVETIL